MPTFLQLHTLTSYPASLLNRDDVGLAKRIPFGSAPRLRISSQCLKRHWRRHDGEHALDRIEHEGGAVGMSVRSRITFQRHIRDPLVAEGLDQEVAIEVTEQVMSAILGESAKAKAKKKKKADEGDEDTSDESCKTSQLTVIGRPELDYLLAEAKAIAEAVGEYKGAKDLAKKVGSIAKKHFDRERKKNLRGLRLGAGLDAALFGRMVTSDILARTDAAIHVAHAFTVHEEKTESDFFSAVDDLECQGGSGSGHIGSAELTSGVFYGYVVVDLPLLISNLTGVDRRVWHEHRGPLAGEVVRRLLHLIATVSPGAKLGSTAPHAYAHFVMAELSAEQPRTLANAFLKPVTARRGDDLMAKAYAKLATHINNYDDMYGSTTERRFAALTDADSLSKALSPEQRMPLPELAKWAAAAARGE
ncbi:MAG TPA: type I-E CRISPR-associated protein Cas7/Cse4/CasC [Nannocystis exedens]|nr:type I-E CRISPR-associated protein Cas7/Cse4/CasC [Nannocystis exedens]